MVKPKRFTCAHCGQDFWRATSKRAKYCGKPCYTAAATMARGNCASCGVPRKTPRTIQCQPCATRAARSPQALHEHECDHCHRRFSVPARRRKYCSVACKGQAKTRPRGTCADCGAPLKTTQATRCRKCAIPAANAGSRPWNKGDLVEVECEVCGVTKKIWPSAVARTRTCGLACAAEIKRRSAGEGHPHARPKLTLMCEFCGTEFIAKPSQAARRRYCSRSCGGSASIRNQGGRTSSLEEAVAAHLDALGVAYARQVRVARFLVDFMIDDLVVEADGAYWHSKPEVAARDLRKNAAIQAAGLRLVRLPERDIRASNYAELDSALEPQMPATA